MIEADLTDGQITLGFKPPPSLASFDCFALKNG